MERVLNESLIVQHVQHANSCAHLVKGYYYMNNMHIAQTKQFTH